MQILPAKIVCDGIAVNVPCREPGKGVLGPFRGEGKLQLRSIETINKHNILTKSIRKYLQVIGWRESGILITLDVGYRVLRDVYHSINVVVVIKHKASFIFPCIITGKQAVKWRGNQDNHSFINKVLYTVLSFNLLESPVYAINSFTLSHINYLN